MGLLDRDIVALSGGHTLVLITNYPSKYPPVTKHAPMNQLGCYFVYRDVHIRRDQILKVLGHRTLSSLITRISCKPTIKSHKS